MSTDAPGSAAARRARAGAWAMGALLAVSACVVFINILGSRLSTRFDVTATGEHVLSPRTGAILSGLDGPYRVVIAGDLRGVDARARDRVFDVLDQFRRASPQVSVTTIDASSESGQKSFDDLVAELAGRDRATLGAQTRQIAEARRGAEDLAAFLEATLSPALDGVREALSPDAPSYEKLAQSLRDLGAAARVAGQDLRAAGARTEEPLKTTVRSVPAPATDKAAAALRDVMAPVVDQLGGLARQLESVARAESISPQARDRAAPLPQAVTAARDKAAAALEPILHMPRPDLRRVADVVSKGAAVLVIGPPGKGVTAVEFTSLFPPGEWLSATGVARADLGRRAEELLGSAISSLRTPLKPIVVLLHGESRAFLELPHRFNRVIDRLSTRGIDVVEWACAVDSEPRGLAKLDPDHRRPVVYVTLAPNTAAGTGQSGEKSGVERAKRLGDTIEQLLTRNESLLVSLTPSALAAFGQPDPVAAPLERLGIKAQTGRPLVRERIGAGGSRVVSEAVASPVESPGPIALAVKGLTLYLEWPIPLIVGPPTGTSNADAPSPLYAVPGDKDTWAESQWSNLWLSRSRPEVMPEKPTFDPARDERRDSYIVAAAVESAGGDQGRPVSVRCVVVGSNTWFVDDRAEPVRVDGRIVDASPGNLELFEASVYWLAHQDDLIAASPGARAVAMIQPISEGQLRLIRLLVILAIPILVLLLGVLYRWARG